MKIKILASNWYTTWEL